MEFWQILVFRPYVEYMSLVALITLYTYIDLHIPFLHEFVFRRRTLPLVFISFIHSNWSILHTQWYFLNNWRQLDACNLRMIWTHWKEFQGTNEIRVGWGVNARFLIIYMYFCCLHIDHILAVWKQFNCTKTQVLLSTFLAMNKDTSQGNSDQDPFTPAQEPSG